MIVPCSYTIISVTKSNAGVILGCFRAAKEGVRESAGRGAAGPVPLELAYDLHPAGQPCSRLLNPSEGGAVSLEGRPADRVDDRVDFVRLLHRIERWKG